MYELDDESKAAVAMFEGIAAHAYRYEKEREKTLPALRTYQRAAERLGSDMRALFSDGVAASRRNDIYVTPQERAKFDRYETDHTIIPVMVRPMRAANRFALQQHS